MATLPQTQQVEQKDEFSPASSFLANVKFDRKGNTLDITFKSGSVRRYLSVFPATFETFRQSKNHSSFYAQAIKGKLPSTPIVSSDIGRNQSFPLKKVSQRRELNAGIKRLDKRNESRPIIGTVRRAGF